jgi:hypothetical protein
MMPRFELREIFVSEANAATGDPLLCWNDGAVKRNIQAFVQAVTDPKSADFVPPAARIAVFDNDGTLWNEQPLYVQLAFAMDRVKALAPEHPEWRTTQPFQAVLEDDLKALGAAGVKGIVGLIMATHAGMTTDEFERIAKSGSRTRSIRGSIGPTPTSPTARWWSCLATSAQTGSRPTLCRAAATSSCA